MILFLDASGGIASIACADVPVAGVAVSTKGVVLLPCERATLDGALDAVLTGKTNFEYAEQPS